MEENKNVVKSIDEYILGYSPEIQEKLNEFRNIISETAPEATEKISWGMATFVLNGNLVHFAGNKKHIGFYPGASAIEKFSDVLKEYKTSVGAIQFPYEKPIPIELVKDIVKFRVKEVLEEEIEEKK